MNKNKKKPDCSGAAISVAAPGNPANLGGGSTLEGVRRNPSSVDFPSLDHSRFGIINVYDIIEQWFVNKINNDTGNIGRFNLLYRNFCHEKIF